MGFSMVKYITRRLAILGMQLHPFVCIAIIHFAFKVMLDNLPKQKLHTTLDHKENICKQNCDSGG